MSRHSHPRVRESSRFTRLRAILAGALVLGVGASVTLASWNDSETATASLTAGRFDVVGSIDGGAFGHHAATSAAALNFPVPLSGMAPGTTTYALFSVKTANPSVAGTVAVAAASTNTTSGTGLGAYLTYGVKTIASGATGACTAASFAAGTTVVAPGSALTASQAAGVTLPVSANGADQINYCLAVTMPNSVDNAAQGKTSAPSWSFSAVSS
ncbi:SipW-dependent-type signal peptide-containing protein [Leifsonia sp. YAF41]|uniref:SipW-dependent-type signal peptide-containing protein n=1 Tax=Leifsonia sp. YAF41 TaxID=3233086 RepID=UPI003F9BF043